MPQTIAFESATHDLIGKMILLKMRVGPIYSRQDGQKVLEVNGYLLTVEQLLALDDKNELTSWGVKEFAETQLFQRPTQESGQVPLSILIVL